MAIYSLNPATDEVIAEYPVLSLAEAQTAAERAHTAFLRWRGEPVERRALAVGLLGRALNAGREKYARLAVSEMGKPLTQALAEIDKCALACAYYAEHGPAFLRDEPVAADAGKSFVVYRPLGAVLAVMPWNFPFWQVFRFLAPALVAGNAALLKHASNVSGCALAVEEICRTAGLPEGLFRTLLLPAGEIAGLIAHPKVAAVTLTGSTEAGREVAATAGRHLKKTVLELGGSDPYVVLADADLEAAAEICAAARCLNSGQSCIAAKRFIVVDAVYERFEKLFVEKMRGQTYGDPLDPGVKMGPLARRDLRDELHAQVEKSLDRGAKLLLGGKIPSGRGAFYPPTVLSGVIPGMPAYDEELFGPVAPLVRVRDETEALRIANDTSYGLGAAVFTKDRAHGEKLAREALDAGTCCVNAAVKSDPRLPFGGVKASGYGRELSVFGLREFVNVKAVRVE